MRQMRLMRIHVTHILYCICILIEEDRRLAGGERGIRRIQDLRFNLLFLRKLQVDRVQRPTVAKSQR
jgi:hypothetical protein